MMLLRFIWKTSFDEKNSIFFNRKTNSAAALNMLTIVVEVVMKVVMVMMMMMMMMMTMTMMMVMEVVMTMMMTAVRF